MKLKIKKCNWSYSGIIKETKVACESEVEKLCRYRLSLSLTKSIGMTSFWKTSIPSQSHWMTHSSWKLRLLFLKGKPTKSQKGWWRRWFRCPRSSSTDGLLNRRWSTSMWRRVPLMMNFSWILQLMHKIKFYFRRRGCLSMQPPLFNRGKTSMHGFRRWSFKKIKLCKKACKKANTHPKELRNWRNCYL